MRLRTILGCLLFSLIFPMSIFHIWVSFSVFGLADWGFRFAEKSYQLFVPLIWFGDEGLGSLNAVLWRWPLFFLESVFGYFGFPSNISDKFLVLWPIIILMPLCGFLVVKQVVKSTRAAFIGSMVFAYSSYFLSIYTHGHQGLALGACFGVFSLYFFMRFLREDRGDMLVFAVLALFISGVFDFRLAYISFFTLFGVSMFFMACGLSGNSFSIFKRIVLIGFAGILFALLNIYWILPFVGTGSMTSNDALGRDFFGNNYFELDNALFLAHPFWNGSGVVWFSNQLIPWWLYIVTILAIAGFWFGRKNKQTLFFSLLAVIGILLSKQVSSPFGSLYPFLYDNLPGFNAFREASKFYPLVALGYAVGVASLVRWVEEMDSWKLYWRHVLIIVIAGLSLWNANSIVTGEIGTMFVSRKISREYYVLKDFMKSQAVFSRFLSVPVASKWHFYPNEHPKVSLVDMVRGQWKDFALPRVDGLKDSEAGKYMSVLNQSFSNNLLDVSSVRYVVVPRDDAKNADDFFGEYGRREYFISELDKLSYLQRRDIGTKDIVVYENEGARPHIYVTREGESLARAVPFEAVDFESKNPTEYVVRLKGMREPLYLNFAERYHPDWKLRAGEFHWFDVLRDRAYFLPESAHAESEAGLNAFRIDPSEVCERYACRRNSDGSYDIDLTLYFRPQSYLYLGLIVSGTTLVLCLGYLGYVGVHHLRRKQA